MLAKIQSISLQKDLELMGSDPFYMFDSSNLVYVIFLLVGIVGFFMIPTISNWIIQSGGMGAYNRRITQIRKRIGQILTLNTKPLWNSKV